MREIRIKPREILKEKKIKKLEERYEKQHLVISDSNISSLKNHMELRVTLMTDKVFWKENKLSAVVYKNSEFLVF